MPAIRPSAIRSIGTVIVTSVLAVIPAAAAAQNAAGSSKWTIEFYGGSSTSSASSKGSGLETFPAGVPFATESGQQSRAVSSWYFGDGALLLNQALSAISNSAAITLPRIVPLDAALLAAGGKPASGGLLGLRLGKALSSKLAIEFSVEKGLGGPELSDALKAAVQASSDSFDAVFTELLATAPVPASTVLVGSALTMPAASSTNIRITGAARWTVFSGNRLGGYLTGGGGVLLNGGQGPSAVLDGRYSFRYFNLFPMNETDRVEITVNQKKTSLIGLVGGGLTFDFSQSTGLRADVQLQLSPSGDVTSLSTSPNVVLGAPSNAMTTLPAPSVQFSNQQNIRSSLSGPNQSLTLFEGTGISTRVSFTLGIFKRF